MQYQLFTSGVVKAENTVQLASGEVAAIASHLQAPPVGRPVMVRAFRKGANWEVLELREAASTPAAPSVFLRPLNAVSSWAIAARLAQRPQDSRFAPSLEAARIELIARGMSHDDIEAMMAATAWALAIMNPPGQSVHEIVADRDDIELALEVAIQRQITDGVEAVTQLLART